MEFCIYCGALLPEGAHTCPNCGNILTASAQPKQAQPEPDWSRLPTSQPAPEQQPVSRPAPQPGPVPAPPQVPPAEQTAAPAPQPGPPRPSITMPAEAQPAQAQPPTPIYAAGFDVQPPRAPEPPAYGSPVPPPPGSAAPYAPYPPYGSQYGIQQGGELSTAGYLGTLLLFMIPVVGFVLMIVWSFMEGVKPERRKLARAYLIRTLILVGVALVLGMVLGIGVAALLAYDPYFFYNFY